MPTSIRSFRYRVAVAIILASPSTSPAQSPLTRVEQAIARSVDANNDSALALLERIVNLNSGTLNLVGVRQVGTILRGELDALGFMTRWDEGEAFHRAGHLVAEHSGIGPRILLIGHLDTVFEPDHPFQRFERIDQKRARGPGIIDMKGGDVIIIQALKALKAAGALDRMNIMVIMNGDEEKPGHPLALARQSLTDLAQRADIAIGFEDGSGDPHKAVIARRGVASWNLTVKGTAAHSSQIFREDVGPGGIFETARILQAFRERLMGQQYLTFNPGVALGGTSVALDSSGERGSAAGKSNVVAEYMSVTGDLRTLSADQLARAKATMRGIVAEHLPQTRSEIAFEDGYPPLAPTEGNMRLLHAADQANRDLGYDSVTATDPLKAGAADISFTAGLVPMAIDGIGLAGWDDHTAKEVADLSTLPMLTKRAAVLLYRLSQTNGTP